jgi:predicted nucleic acid-binding protein
VDGEIALRAGHLLAVARSNGVDPGGEDALIAATADLRGLKPVTFDVVHFQPMGVALGAPI